MFKRLHITFPTLCLHVKAQIPFTFYFVRRLYYYNTFYGFIGKLEI